MTSPPIYDKVHEWLMKSPDPPRQSRERTVASTKAFPVPLSKSSPKPSPTSSLKDTPPSHELVLQSSSIIGKAAIIKPASEKSVDTHKPETAVNDDKNQRDRPLELLDKDEKIQIEDDPGTDTACLPSTSIWEDAATDLACGTPQGNDEIIRMGRGDMVPGSACGISMDEVSTLSSVADLQLPIWIELKTTTCSRMGK
ncbi:hypothetical protein EIK77_009652 [Talaromyces pinophilus]|nr:hypothetical protein EIK77_009652 [Talaromyces pinophilus]